MNISAFVSDSQKLPTSSRVFWLFYLVLLTLTLCVFRHFSTALIWGFTIIPILAAEHLRKQIFQPINHPLFALPLVFCLIGCLLSLWSLSPGDSFKVGVTGILTIYLLAALQQLLSRIDATSLKTLIWISLIAVAIALPLVIIQVGFHVSLRALVSSRPTVVKTYSDLFLALSIPLAAYLWIYERKKGMSLGLLTAVFCNAIFSNYSVGYLALPMSALLALPAYFAPKFIPRLYAWIAAAFTLGHTTFIHYLLKFNDPKTLLQKGILENSGLMSFYHRLLHWEFSLMKIREKPYLGHGFEAARYMPDGKEEFLPGLAYLPSHSHDFILQVWLESGLLGITILALFIYMIFTSLSKNKAPSASFSKEDRVSTFWALFYLSVCCFIFALSHSLWHKWVLTAFGAGGLLLREIVIRKALKSANAA